MKHYDVIAIFSLKIIVTFVLKVVMHNRKSFSQVANSSMIGYDPSFCDGYPYGGYDQKDNLRCLRRYKNFPIYNVPYLSLFLINKVINVINVFTLNRFLLII